MANKSLSSADNISTASQQDIAIPEWLSQFEAIKRTSIERRDIFLLGVTTVIGGQYNGWNPAYDGGFWSAFFSVVVSIIGYIMLTFCLAEMTSALPFSGGIYGFVRAFSFAHLGFVIACFEMVVNIFYASTNVIALAELFQVVMGGSEEMVLFYCVMIYMLILSVCLIGGKIFWAVNTLLGTVSLALILIFILGSIPNCDFDRWASGEKTFDASSAIAYLGPGSSVFLGIQFLSLTSKCAKDPKNDIPQMMNLSIILLSITAMGILFTVASQSPGIEEVKSAAYPLNYGFARIFNLSEKQAGCLSIPGLFGSSFGFLFCYGRQSNAMARSGFLPSIFLKTIPFFDTPYVTLLIGCFVSFLLNIICFYQRHYIAEFFDTCILASYTCFIAALVAYLQFHHKYSSLARSFSSPFGDKGAYLGIAIFGMSMIGIFIYHAAFPYCFLGALFIVSFGIFHFCLQQNQIFSEEEKQELFKAYLINANLATKDRILKKKKQIMESVVKSNNNSKNHSKNEQWSKSNQQHPLSISQTHGHEPQRSKVHHDILSESILEDVEKNQQGILANSNQATPEESPEDSPNGTERAVTQHSLSDSNHNNLHQHSSVPLSPRAGKTAVQSSRKDECSEVVNLPIPVTHAPNDKENGKEAIPTKEDQLRLGDNTTTIPSNKKHSSFGINPFDHSVAPMVNTTANSFSSSSQEHQNGLKEIPPDHLLERFHFKTNKISPENT